MGLTKEELKERRAELFRCVKKNGSGNLKEIAKELSDEYNVSMETVRNDWYNRDDWLSDVFDFGETAYIFNDIIAEQKEAKKELWDVVDRVSSGESDNLNAKIGALKQINKMSGDMLESFQSHGDVEKEPERHKVEAKVEHEGLREELKNIRESMDNG